MSELKTKDNHQKQKSCVMCNKGFLGRADTKTCSDACRMKMSRAALLERVEAAITGAYHIENS